MLSLDPVVRPAPALEAIDLSPPRIVPTGALSTICDTSKRARASHCYGKSYRDLLRALSGRFEHPPDCVFRPEAEDEVSAVLDWCASSDVAVIPYGGGSSVVGGVEADVGDSYAGAVTLDLSALDSVLEVDPISRAARIQAGVLGPALESQLRPRGLTLRHFPQSFEFSSLGGWIATRSGGHFATGPTHIDDMVESLRVLTPAGCVETRRLPASGAGPSPDRLFIGSEGTLGVVTEAWMRLRQRPRWRAGGPTFFKSFFDGAACVRALAQSGLQPSNCRLIDALEALVNRAGDGSEAVLLIGFESADHPLDSEASRAAELVCDFGGRVADTWSATGQPDVDEASGRASGPPGRDPTREWRRSFLRAPYVRDALVRIGALCDTFETAITWDSFEELHAEVGEAARAALSPPGQSEGFVTCRLTHAYPDGAAPYFTVVAPARRGAELEQWWNVKNAVSEAMLRVGGTITHHHAVGRDHRRWYDRQRPDLFAHALKAAKMTFDPRGVCNPGVLVDADRPPGGR